MREIKFRAFDTYTNRIVSWEEIKESCELDSFFDLVSFEKMQFTGLKDIEGKDIYEGDILADDCLRKELYDDGTYSYGEVLFKDGKFLQAYTHKDNAVYYDDVAPSWLKIKVVGNIHENPELLNK